MALLNIGASNKDDAFYRYKMPRLVTKIEGRGNGIKTNLVNMVDVAKALARPPSYTTKFFGCELGAQSKFDEKTGTSIVNGSHDTSKLVALLEHFIKKYVQCYGCGNPETEVVVTKMATIQLKCAACGFLSDVDMRDKLTTFILKNPPETKRSGKDKKLRRAEKERLQEGEAADEENKKSKKDSRKKKGHDDKASTGKKKQSDEEEELLSPVGSHHGEEDEPEVDDDDDNVQWSADTSAEAAQKRIEEQLTSVTTEMVMESVVEESPRPVKNGKTKKLSSKKSEIKEADLPKMEELSLHDKLVKEMKSELAKKSASGSKMAPYLAGKAGPRQEVVNAYFEALFSGSGKDLHKEVAKKKGFVAALVQDEESQGQILAALEALCGSEPEACKQVALVLKALYDADIVEEESFLRWFKLTAKSGDVKKSAKPFVEWLENAESEEDDEDEEEEEEE